MVFICDKCTTLIVIIINLIYLYNNRSYYNNNIIRSKRWNININIIIIYNIIIRGNWRRTTCSHWNTWYIKTRTRRLFEHALRGCRHHRRSRWRLGRRLRRRIAAASTPPLHLYLMCFHWSDQVHIFWPLLILQTFYIPHHRYDTCTHITFPIAGLLFYYFPH